MLFATLLFLLPVPQNGDAANAMTNRTQVVSAGDSSATKDSSSRPLPDTPQPKVSDDGKAANGADSASSVNPSKLAASDASGPGAGAFAIQPVKPGIARPSETPRQRKLWYALTFSGSAAAAFDAWSTRRAVSGHYGTEANPLLRPFSHSGAMYAATQVNPVVMDYLGKRMMVSQHKWLRRLWWLPQSAGTGLSLASGAHNVSITP